MRIFSFVVFVQSFSHVQLFVIPWILVYTVFHHLLELAQNHGNSVMPSKYLILCHPLLLLPSIFPSIRVFPNELALCIRWLKYWSFSISPSNECTGLISFRIDLFDLLAVQGTHKSLLSPSPQFKSINSLVLSLLYGPTRTSYMTPGKTIALTIQTFLAK